MSGLSDAIGGWMSPFRLNPEFSPVRTKHERERLECQLLQVVPKAPPRADLEEVYRALAEACASGGTGLALSKRQLRLAPWVLFENWGTAPALASDGRFMDAFLARLTTDAVGSRAAVNLAQAFLLRYPTELANFEDLRARTKQLLKRGTSPRCRRLCVIVEKFGLLDKNGPERVRQQVAALGGSVEELLQDMQLAGPLSRAGLAAAAFELACTRANHWLGSKRTVPVDLPRLLEFAVVMNGGERELRFSAPSHRQLLPDSILPPFALNSLPAETREMCKAFFLENYKDPRFERGPWQGVSDAAREVMYGWLVEDTLEDFFRLLQHAAKGDLTAQRHWRARRAFWSAYLRAGHICDAWVVLSPRIDHEARRRLRGSEHAYGKLEAGSGVQPNHAVLMLRIDRLVITDWSHNGKYRVWDEGRRHAKPIPVLYRRVYRRADMVNSPDHDGAHHGSENGVWQRHLAGFIRDATGITMTTKELLPGA